MDLSSLFYFQTTFRASECRAPKVELFATVVVQDKLPVFLDPQSFTDVQHYKRLLGYDQPINFADEDDSERTTSDNVHDVKDREKPS